MRDKPMNQDASADLLTGVWHEGGLQPFPGWERLICRRYVWRTPNGFEIPFLVPTEPGPRRFFAEPLLNAWHRRQAPADFVDRVCRKGLPVLAGINRYESEQDAVGAPPLGMRPSVDDLLFYFEVFKLRRTGNEAVNRRLSKRDLLTKSHEVRACLIPGAPKQTAHQRSAADIVRFFGIEYLNAVKADSKPRESVSTTDLLGSLVGFAGQAFIDGVDQRSWTSVAYKTTWQSVASTVVAGLDLFNDQECALEQESEFREFVGRLHHGWLEKGEEGFAKWAARERQRKWHRLLAGYHEVARRTRCKRVPSPAVADELKERATRYFRILLWVSHVQMGLAFGAVMTAAWTTFCDSKLIAPTHAERRIYRLLNAPQRFLAGLPLAFVPLEPLTWIIPFLLDRLNGDGEELLERSMSDILGLYSATIAEVRQRDADGKRSKATGDLPAWGLPSRGPGQVDRNEESGRAEVDRVVFDPEPMD
ncbi:MAG: hypothetical protein C0467_30890 [Planctomycetaceae bacterium]|nr:hypothetical protein [Planctomycetaceae bacterium]